jgi:hypothetical protein
LVALSETSSSPTALSSLLLLLPFQSSLLVSLLLADLRALLFFANMFWDRDLSRPLPQDLLASPRPMGVLVRTCPAPNVVDVVSIGDDPLTPCSFLSLLQDCDGESRPHLPAGLTAGFRPWERLDDEVDEPADSRVLQTLFSLASCLKASVASLSASRYSSCPG